MVSLGRSMPVVPAHPAEYVARLDELAAEARAVTSDDAALAKIAADAAARIEAIAAAARAFAAREGEASRKVLLDAMERGELVVAEGEHRCVEGGGASQGRLSAAALESGSGRLPASLLRRALAAGAPAFRRCVEAGLARDPGLVGAVRVRFVVERDGRVSEAVDADRAPPDPEAWASSVKAPPVRDVIVSDCVVAALKLLAFPRPQGGSFSATYTLEVGSR